MKPNIFWRLLGWFMDVPGEQLACPHPLYARDYRLNLLAEQEAFDAYEICLNCGKEWHAKKEKR